MPIPLVQMRRFSPVMWGVATVLAAMVVLVLSLRRTSAPPPRKPTAPTTVTRSVVVDDDGPPSGAPLTAAADLEPAKTDGRDARTAGSPLATELNTARGDAERDVETLHALLRQYLRHLRGRQALPIGNDSDLARVLTGHNPMKLVVIPPNHPAIGKDGRLRDRWGRPYFIHPRGNNAFEIRSAGADRRMFTSDDVVANPLRKEPE